MLQIDRLSFFLVYQKFLNLGDFLFDFVDIFVVVPDGSGNVRIHLFKPEKEIIVAN